jgi:hypothetical protein
MDELEMIHALRPDHDYPDGQRRAARTVLLAEAASTSGWASPPARARRGRRRMPRPARLGGLVAAGAAIAVVAAYLAGSGAGQGPVRSGAAPAAPAAQVLQLAAQTARTTATPMPAGARWSVWVLRHTSTASPAARCQRWASVAGNPYRYVYAAMGWTSCQAQGPASIPRLRGAQPVPERQAPHWADLPTQPGPLLAAIYRDLRAAPGDQLPGKPKGTETAADYNVGAFETLGDMLSSGLTSPPPAAQLAAMARIPGIEIVRGARTVLGIPAIEITVHGTGNRDSVFLDPGSYAYLGNTFTVSLAGPRPPVTITQVKVWQAYYDSNGSKL